MAKPFVSVLIDTYNHERFIEQAMASVLEQDFPVAEREILVVDDGSTDATPEKLKTFSAAARILRKENGGQASAFNAGIPECRGEIVAFLDGDDWWAPGKLSRVVEALCAEPEVGIVGHGITQVYTDGREHTEQLRDVPRFRLNSEEGARAFRLRKSFLGTSRMTVRASVLREIGRVPEAIRIQADEYLFTLAGALADTLILRESLTYYRLHEGNAFQIADGNVEALRRKHAALAGLAQSLREELQARNVPAGAARMVTEWLQTEAELLRLSLENGWPTETVRTELVNYRIAHSDASFSQWMLKCIGLLPALVLPSRAYYGMRNKVTRNGLYRQARQKWLHFPKPPHVDRHETKRS